MIYQKKSSCFPLPLVLFCIFSLSGCNPELYKQPAQDFKIATESLENAYFMELDISNKARIQRGDLEDQIAIWSAPPEAIDKSYTERVSLNMTKRRGEDIHQDITALRQIAFDVLDGYASVLVSLASEESTEAIVTELNGLRSDITTVLDMVGQVTKSTEQLSRYVGPLQQYVEVLSELARLVSNVLRERAIIETIGASNDSVLELLTVLKSEAGAASKNSQPQIALSRQELESFLTQEDFEGITNVGKSLIAQKIADFKTLEAQMGSDNIEDSFDAAVRAQGALVRKAVLSDPQDWVSQIRTFRDRVAKTRENIRRIRSDI